jgi:hypothetical protein
MDECKRGGCKKSSVYVAKIEIATTNCLIVYYLLTLWLLGSLHVV